MGKNFPGMVLNKQVKLKDNCLMPGRSQSLVFGVGKQRLTDKIVAHSKRRQTE